MSILLTNNVRAECTKKEKFSILHEAAGAECSIENFEFFLRSARTCMWNHQFYQCPKALL